MIHQMWRLSEGGDDNLGLALTPEGLALGRTRLVERRDDRFAVRGRDEIALLLGKAYSREIAVDRLMAGLERVASALNAGDRCLAAIFAVHLKLPDVPNKLARDDLETADTLIKYGDWNPELHPRAGTPPNPGWFAATGGANASAGVEVAQNDDPNRRSDASPAPTDNWVRLKPGPERVDELADFIEWLANATPDDEKTIRAEIKRYYYDAGDPGSAALLNSALSVVLRPGTTQETRQKILNSLDVHTRADPRDYVPIRDLLTGGAIAVGAAGRAASSEAVSGEAASGEAAAEGGATTAATAVARSEAWTWGWAKRGRYFDTLLRDKSLPPNFPTIDNFTNGVATSIKSIDLNAATYQDAARLTTRLNKYVNEVSNFDGREYAGKIVSLEEISEREMSLVIPKGSITETQRAAIEAVESRAATLNRPVRLKMTEF